jgi:UDP-N-acetylglucosamine 2-epimerase (non-hydrolysing)
MQNLPQADKSDILKRLNLDGDYLLVTVHRAENSNESSLNDVFETLCKLELPTVFPMHPRLQNMSLVQKWRTRSDMAHVQFIKPLGYHDMLKVVKEAKVVLTDSGGLQREAFWLHVPCITLRKVTEWPETVENGSNYLLGIDKVAIFRVVKNIVGKNLKVKGGKDSIGNGKASEAIVNALLENRFSAEV